MIEIILGIVVSLVAVLFSFYPNSITSIFSNLLPSNLSLTLFAIAFSSASVVFSFISNFLFIQDQNSLIGVLPAQRMFLNKKGNKLILLLAFSLLSSLLFSILVLTFFEPISVALRLFFRENLTFYILTVLLFVLSERKPKKIFFASLVWVFVGFFGVVCDHLPIPDAKFPLLAGLFGLSTLFLSFENNITIPKQNETEEINLSYYPILGSLLGFLASLMPGFGVSLAVIAASIAKLKTEDFCMLLPAAVLSNYMLSSTLAETQLETNFLFTTIFVSVSLAILVMLLTSNYILRFVSSIDSQKLYLSIAVLTISTTFVQTGVTGLLVLATSAAIGVSVSLLKIKRSHCLAALIIPSLFYYLW